MKIRLRGRDARCPLCRVRHLEGDAETYRCSGCEVRYHGDCARELGGCSTLGCERLGLGPDDATPEEKRGERLRRGLRASRERRRNRGRLAAEHRAERTRANEQSSLLRDGAFDAGVEAGCCCALGILEVVLTVLLAGFLLFPPGVKVAKVPTPSSQASSSPAPNPPAEAR